MKIVISAAGKGTRMLHLTKNKPKHLIEIKGKPFLWYLLRNVKKAKFSQVVLIVGYKAEAFFEVLRWPIAKKLKLNIVNQFDILGKKKYGTACPLLAARKLIGKENFVSLCGDNLYSSKDLRAFKINDKFNYIAGLEHKHPEKYGTLITKNDFLTRIDEKIKKPKSNIINAGLFKFTPEIFKAINQVKPSKRGEYELTDAVTSLAKQKKVKVKLIQDYWLDFGNPADIIKLSRFLSRKKS